jgi:1,5-anhydro-D-fructose reductase (1,5-anhydro-D-mannitol-forming)
MAMIRIGIVGCGRILNAHLQGYRQLREAGIDDFRITALCARKREDALMFRRRGEGPAPRLPVLDPSTGDPLAAPHIYLDDFQPDTNVAVYTDYREIIASGDVDAVNDFTSLFMHHQVGMAALDAGQHLLTQKPLAISVKAGRALVDKASAKGLTLGVFENVRQSLGTRVAAWVVRQGLIGDLQMALVGGIGGLWSPDKVVADTPWRHRKLLGGGGGTIDIGVHVMHLLRYVCGEIQVVQGTVRTFEPTRAMRDSEGQTLETVPADVDDTYFATVLFENGAVGQMLWSWSAHGEPASIPGAPIFYGTKGCLKGGEVILDDGTRTSANDLFESQADQALKECFFPLGLREPFAVSQYDWLRAIEQGVQPETSGEQGLRDLAASFAMIESSQRQAAVMLDAVLDGRVDDYQAEINEYYGL